jgi:iron(III) transport system substrate-binding protein
MAGIPGGSPRRWWRRSAAADLPNTWEELIDPKWEGQVIVDPRGRPFDALSLAWGREQTLDYAQRLKDIVKPLIIEGATASIVAVASGEAAIATSARDAETLEQQSKNVPVDIKWQDVVTTSDSYNMVLANAPHPNAIRCFIGWLTTDGLELHHSVEFKNNDSVPPGAPAGATVVAIDTPEQAAAVKAIGKEISAILTGG